MATSKEHFEIAESCMRTVSETDVDDQVHWSALQQARVHALLASVALQMEQEVICKSAQEYDEDITKNFDKKNPGNVAAEPTPDGTGFMF